MYLKRTLSCFQKIKTITNTYYFLSAGPYTKCLIGQIHSLNGPDSIIITAHFPYGNLRFREHKWLVLGQENTQQFDD